MAACPPLEDIAAFLDGTLSPEERARITEHLARCESCYEIFAGAVHFAADTGGRGVLPFPLRNEQDRAPRRISRWLPLAASVVLAVGLGWAGWQWFFVPPELTLAGVIAPLEKKPLISDDLYKSEGVRGGPEDFAPLSLLGPEFMVGVHLIDLRLSVQANDVNATATRLQGIGNELRDVPGLSGMSLLYHDEYGKMHTTADLDRFAAQLPDWETELQGSLADSLPFQFGLWAEAGRLAAEVRSPQFFEIRKNRRFLSHLQKTLPGQLTPELRDPVLDDLQAIEHIWDEGDLSKQDFSALASHFQNIIRRIDDYEEDLTSYE